MGCPQGGAAWGGHGVGGVSGVRVCTDRRVNEGRGSHGMGCGGRGCAMGTARGHSDVGVEGRAPTLWPRRGVTLRPGAAPGLSSVSSSESSRLCSLGCPTAADPLPPRGLLV